MTEFYVIVCIINDKFRNISYLDDYNNWKVSIYDAYKYVNLKDAIDDIESLPKSDAKHEYKVLRVVQDGLKLSIEPVK